MSKPKPWTPEEDAKLETLANAGKSWDAIAGVIGRSKSSCQSRASSPNSPVTLSEEGMRIRRRGNLTEGLYIGLDYEKVCFAQKKFP